MNKILHAILIAGVSITLFTSCSPKVTESASENNAGSSSTSSSSSSTQNMQPLPGESRHHRDPKLKNAEDYLKKDPTPIGRDGKPR